jgi:hypothetical protein
MDVRADGAHVDEQPSLDATAQEPIGIEVDVLDRSVVDEERDHDLHMVHQVGQRGRPAGSGLTRLVGVGNAAIPYAKLMATLEQPPHDRRTHAAGPRNSDFHDDLL